MIELFTMPLIKELVGFYGASYLKWLKEYQKECPERFDFEVTLYLEKLNGYFMLKEISK